MKFFKSKFFIIVIVLFFSLNTFIIFGAVKSIPDQITINKHETDGKWLLKKYSFFLSAEDNIKEASQTKQKSVNPKNSSANYTSTVYLCGIVPVKTVEVALIEDVLIVPGGEAIGINLKTDGVLAVGFSSFSTLDGKEVSPAKKSGIRIGDIISEINGTAVAKSEDVQRLIEQSAGKIKISGKRGSQELSWSLSPIEDTQDNKKKIGLWIRESVAGIGTVSFYKDEQFAALGHPISDIDTGKSAPAKDGSVCRADIVGIEKGKKGSPGSLMGVFSGKSTGSLYDNSYCGVFGTLDNAPSEPRVKLAHKEEVHAGKAKLRCDVGEGTESFDIEIVRLTKKEDATKSMIIKITDETLLEKTGGIVQGMSGSPILQKGRLAGVLTHVFVNDPKKGYAIFAETMYKEMIGKS